MGELPQCRGSTATNSSGTGSYMYNRAMSSTDGLGTSPANPYSMAGEYGPAATDVHHRVLAGRRCYTQVGIRPSPEWLLPSTVCSILTRRGEERPITASAATSKS